MFFLSLACPQANSGEPRVGYRDQRGFVLSLVEWECYSLFIMFPQIYKNASGISGKGLQGNRKPDKQTPVHLLCVFTFDGFNNYLCLCVCCAGLHLVFLYLVIKIYRFFEKNKERKKIYIVVLFNQKYTGKYKQKSESISSLSFFSFLFFCTRTLLLNMRKKKVWKSSLPQ